MTKKNTKPAKPRDWLYEIAPDQYARIAKKQRKQLHSLAALIETGGKLTPNQADLVAAIVRWKADSITNAPKRKRGRRPSVNHQDVAINVRLRMDNGMKKTPAIKSVAADFGIPPEAVRQKILPKYEGKSLALWVPGDWERYHGVKVIRGTKSRD